MEPLIRAALLGALVAGCGAPTTHSAASPSQVAPTRYVRAGKAPAARTADAKAQALCGRGTWRGCFEVAEHLRHDGTRGYDAQAVVIYRGLCAEGDERRCFEADTPSATHAACADDALIDACRVLGDLYRDGLATCPADSACAEDLYAMACVAGDDQACTAEARLTAARGGP